MKVKRGDVVLLPIAFLSGGGVKVRPALVVQSDHNNVRLTHTIVAIITTTTHRTTNEATQLLIDVASPEGKQSGLLHTSAIKCEHLDTVALDDIIRVVGSLPSAIMTQVETCMRASLAIP